MRKIKKLIEELRSQGDSQAAAIADVLEGADSLGLARAILEAFRDIASGALKRV